jgi:hypothetical protein
MGPPDKNECWESDRGIQVNVRDIKDGSVVVELVGTTLGTFAVPLELFARTFTHPAERQPPKPVVPTRGRPRGAPVVVRNY